MKTDARPEPCVCFRYLFMHEKLARSFCEATQLRHSQGTQLGFFVLRKMRSGNAHGMGQVSIQGKGKGRAFSRGAFCGDDAAMQFHQSFDDEQSQAGSFVVFDEAVVSGSKAVEDVGKEFRLDSLAFIADGDVHVVRILAERYENVSTSWHMLDAVGQQI